MAQGISTDPVAGATSAGQSGPMVQAAVDDAPGILLTGQVGPLSLTNDGRLRVSVAPARMGVEFYNTDEVTMWGSGAQQILPQNTPW